MTSPSVKTILAALLLLTAVASAQVDPYHTLFRSSRLAVLSFANYTGDNGALPVVMTELQNRLPDVAVELADPMQVREALRTHRIRAVAELTVNEVQTLANDLEVRYLLAGSISRYASHDSISEVALAARLIDAASMTVVWSNAVTVYRNPRARFLGFGGTYELPQVLHSAVANLVRDLRYSPPEDLRMVTALRLNSGSEVLPCRRVAVLTFGNETTTEFAGHILAGQLMPALMRQGFTVADPGRVREVMLAAQSLSQGEVSLPVLRQCAEELGVDFVLTGTVSEYSSVLFEETDEPAVACEARLVDTRTGNVVWARSISRKGKDSALLFDVGTVHSLTLLSDRAARELAAAIPATRSRIIETADR